MWLGEHRRSMDAPARLPQRLARLPLARVGFGSGTIVAEATGLRARALGLMGLRQLSAGVALRIPRCRSVHTFGMRFALDLLWLDADRRVVRVDRGVAPRRFAACRAAASVLEVRAGDAARFERAGRLQEGAPSER